MKQIFTLLLGFSFLAITTLSCKKDPDYATERQAAAPQAIQANVPAGETYVFDMGIGTSASIVTQAKHHQLSEVSTTPDGATVYRYTAAKGYAGADEVTLQQMVTSTAQSGGCSNNHNHSSGHTTTSLKMVSIKFTVAN